jgi:hypothetical protein
MSNSNSGKHFQLHTLWLEHGHDLAGIVTNQPNLRFLGIYSDSKPDWKKINKLFRSQNAMPTIILLKCLTEPITLPLEIFPASHRPGQVLQECREIERSIREFQKVYYYRGRSCYLTFNLLGLQEENLKLLVEVMEGIAVCFPDLAFTSVEIRVDNIAIRARLPLLENLTQLTH